jgi:hypothetical protein
MKKITYIGNKVIEVKDIPEGIHPDFGHSYLEMERRNCFEYEIGQTIFFVESSDFPTCDLKYISRNETGFVEMSDSQKADVDYIQLIQTREQELNWLFKRPLRLTIPVYLSLAEYKDFSTLIFARQTPFTYNETTDSNTIYFDFLQKVEVNNSPLFQLNNQTVVCNDPRLSVEQLYTKGYLQDSEKIYHE